MDVQISKCADKVNFTVIAMNGLRGEEAIACYTEPLCKTSEPCLL